jgi:hypothetical protein
MQRARKARPIARAELAQLEPHAAARFLRAVGKIIPDCGLEIGAFGKGQLVRRQMNDQFDGFGQGMLVGRLENVGLGVAIQVLFARNPAD